jgi:KDO2-lipid IV(A) lauroyltransferase
VASLGPERAFALARRAGDLLRRLDGRHRRVAEENVRRALPDRTPEEHRRIVRGSFQSMVLGGVELLFLKRLLTRDSLRRLISIEGLDRVGEELAGRGAIFATAHIGNWEVLGASLGLTGAPLHSVARPMDNPYLDRYLLGFRTSYGQTIIPKKGALRPLIEVLRGGGYLAMLVDQDARRRGIFVDFFGRAASTIPTPATLAIRFGVPIVCGCCLRNEDSLYSFRFSGGEILEADRGADREEETRRLTAEINRHIEGWIRENPHQYLWQHRRWKTRPPQEKAAAVAAGEANA